MEPPQIPGRFSVNDLTAFELDAHLGQRLVKAIKQGVRQFVFPQCFAKSPYGARIGDVACKRHSQKAYERQAVCNLVLQAFVRQTIEPLQDEHFEHENATGWFASGVALAHLGVHAFKNGAKYLPVDNRVEPVQWVTRLAQAGVAVLKVKEAVLRASPVCFWVSFYNVFTSPFDDAI